MQSRFLLGQIRATPASREALGRVALDLVARHAICEFGVISRRQILRNITAMDEMGEIQSRYYADPTNKRKGFALVTTTPGGEETIISIEGEDCGIDF